MAKAPRSGASAWTISTIRDGLQAARCSPSEVAPLVVTEYEEKGLKGAGDSVVSDSVGDILSIIAKRTCVVVHAPSRV